MKLLMVPDIHLGKGSNIGVDPVGVGLNSRVEDQKNLLDFIHAKAIENNVDTIILLGDIWDDVNPKPNVVFVFLSWLRRCIESKIKVHIIHGNHDYVRSGKDKISMLDCVAVLSLDGCKIHSTINTIDFDDIDITFIPFTDRRQLGVDTIDEAVAKLSEQIKENISKNKNKIAVGHLALKGSLWIGDEIGDDSNEIFCPVEMFEDFTHVFMGHIHKSQVTNKSKPFMCHVGSVERTTFSKEDSLSKSMVLFDSSSYKHEKIKLPCRKLVDIDVRIPEDVKDSTLYLKNIIEKQSSMENSIVRIKVKLSSSDSNGVDKEVITAELNKMGISHVSSFSEIKCSERVLSQDIDIDEYMNHEKAVDKFMEFIEAEDFFKKEVSTTCKKIIKDVAEGE